MNQIDHSHNVDSKSPSEIKKEFVAFLQNRDISPEILRQALKTLEQEKPELLEPYQPLSSDEDIVESNNEWLLTGYFDKQVYLCKKNFSRERIDHVLSVKSHCIEKGIAGFSSSAFYPSNSERNTTMNPFKNIDLKGYNPSPSLQKYLEKGDLSNIRNALFMEMNDKRITQNQIKQAFAWVLKHKSNLFVPYGESANARAMNTDSTQYDQNYYGMQEVYASSNFSWERLSHMVEVRGQVFNIAKTADTPTEATPKTEQKPSSGARRPTQHQPSSSSDTPNNNNWIKCALIIGGAVAALATLIISITR